MVIFTQERFCPVRGRPILAGRRGAPRHHHDCGLGRPVRHDTAETSDLGVRKTIFAARGHGRRLCARYFSPGRHVHVLVEAPEPAPTRRALANVHVRTGARAHGRADARPGAKSTKNVDFESSRPLPRRPCPTTATRFRDVHAVLWDAVANRFKIVAVRIRVDVALTLSSAA